MNFQKQVRVTIWDNNDKIIFYKYCFRIDITENESIFYNDSNPNGIHFPWYVKSTLVRAKTITVF